jgi:SAM-dependent methyltransferase
MIVLYVSIIARSLAFVSTRQPPATDISRVSYGGRMDGGEGWSEVAAQWSALWGEWPKPVWVEVVAAADIHAGSKVLDVGCGAGEFLAFVAAQGADAVGVDPAAGMRAIAQGDVREGDAEHLPFGDHEFDVVTAFNALQFAEDTMDALAELARVAKPGARIAIANWAERARNDLDAIELALSDEDPTPDGELRVEGGLEQLLSDAGFIVESSGLTLAPWSVATEAQLVDGVLLGEDESVKEELRATIVGAAAAFTTAHGYTLVNAMRWAVARVP